MQTALVTTLFVLLVPQDPKTVSITDTNGERIQVQVLSQDGESVKLKVFVLGGHMQVKRKLADFTPASVFVIERELNPPQGFDGHFAMAKRAVELGLVPQAGAQARAAIESVEDPQQAEARRAEVRGWAAGALEDLLKQAIGDGRTKDARHYLKLLSTRLSEQRSEEQLGALSDMVEALEAKDREAKQAARQAKLDAKVRDDIARKLKPIEKNIEAGDKDQREAIARSRSTATSARLCEQAIAHYKAAWKALQALVEKHEDDGDLAQTAAAMGTRLHDSAIAAALHAANMLTVQSNYKGALEWTDRILAFDAGNAEAKEMRRTIQIAEAAASSQWGWDWGIVGGQPRPDPKN